MTDLLAQALNAAKSSLWQEAARLNLEILKEEKEDTEALNRLAHAYKELGQIKESLAAYRKVLKLDRFNPIASKNLKFLEALPKNLKKTGSNNNVPKNLSETFLEEPGKTKIVNLINLAPLSILMGLSCGSPVNLAIKRHTVNAVDQTGSYLGALPDDLSAKLMRLIDGGNRYEAFVKTVAKKALTIFVRELSRANRFKNQPSFPVISTNHLYHEDELKMADPLEEKTNDEEIMAEDEAFANNPNR